MTDDDRAKMRAERAASLRSRKAHRPEPVQPSTCSACWRLPKCIGACCPIGRGE